jgi:hypothetical protein
MSDSCLLPDLVARSAERFPENAALIHGEDSMTYAALWDRVGRFAGGVAGLSLLRGERVAIYLEKRFEVVIASFGAPAAGGMFVPAWRERSEPQQINPRNARTLGQIDRGKTASFCKLGPAVSHTIVWPVGVRYAHPYAGSGQKWIHPSGESVLLP